MSVAAIITAGSAIASYVAMETLALPVERLIIKDPQLPKPFHNLKVCFISDIHHGPISSGRRLWQLIKKINNLAPDLLILGGDYLQAYQKNHAKPRVNKAFGELLTYLAALAKPPLGIYAVLGNHDHCFGAEKITKEFAKIGIKVLDNQGIWLHRGGAKIRLVGVSDLWFGQPNVKAGRGDAKATDFLLLVSHQPNYIDQITAADHVNFMLAGHTHGAQVRAFNYMPFLPNKIARWEYTEGLIETPQTRMLVSPGIGVVVPYFRTFSKPKINLLIFKAAPRLSKFAGPGQP